MVKKDLSATYQTTGSDKLTKRIPICFVDAEEAKRIYGVEIRTGGPCPECNASVIVYLSFNPNDSNYYFKCPVCGVWLLWCDINGNYVKKFKKVKSKKSTPLDIDLEEERWWSF